MSHFFEHGHDADSFGSIRSNGEQIQQRFSRMNSQKHQALFCGLGFRWIRAHHRSAKYAQGFVFRDGGAHFIGEFRQEGIPIRCSRQMMHGFEDGKAAFKFAGLNEMRRDQLKQAARGFHGGVKCLPASNPVDQSRRNT